ncbi:hypothetical protein BD324DRAFT_637310 [Kockovaella imperatae]|uniref:GDP/GTP exchange factor Sec2 N-terminal domain-containing protein n=1 Tax=Kockovaella imperatae TaxID=4999 RepID=A0A1Y1U8C9_9TREE|nr:hypothetical protein BD324DRAFT_637310 [Kockovaella imperatae]ORX34268.1 hypothetical protein BD324DRAFT_637310 [Kockovaella imperatae]
MAFHGLHPMPTSGMYEGTSALRRANTTTAAQGAGSRARPATSSGVLTSPKGNAPSGLGSATPSRPMTPSVESQSSFDFSVPSLPPRLANFGRKISQMRDELMEGLDPTTIERPKTSPRQSTDSTKTRNSLPPPAEEVPGMGDEPVMCPFCEKPLPPALFHVHQTPVKKPTVSRPNIKRPVTATGSAAPFGLSSTAPSSRVNSISLDSPEVKTKKLLDPLPLQTPKTGSKSASNDIIRSPDPSVTSESLYPQVSEGDKLNHAAAELHISDEDIRRWSNLAGISPPTIHRHSSAPPSTNATLDVQSSTSRKDSLSGSQTKPPPNDRHSSRGSSSRFNFFRRPSSSLEEEDESEDEGKGRGGGYSKLLGAGSAGSDDEGDNTIHAEPQSMHEDQVEEKDDVEVLRDDPPPLPNGKTDDSSVPTITPSLEHPKVTSDELRSVLQEVLGKIGELTKSHNALLTSQSTLLTSLKIARSNLAMAEANTEMLEAQLKQAKAAAPPPPAPVRAATGHPATPTINQGAPKAPNTAPVGSSSMTGEKTITATPQASERGSFERPRPTSLQTALAATEARAGEGEKSSWGFWNGGKKRLTTNGQQALSNLPTPTAERSSFDFVTNPSSGGPYSAALPLSAEQTGLQRASSERPLARGINGKTISVDDLIAVGGPTGTVASPGSSAQPASEILRLRQAYSTAQTRMESMSKELTELKKGKVEMEAELENLSQALFEEANKMVADERRKRAEMEDALKELKAEKDALKSTIKVLGGNSGSVASGDESDATSTTSKDDSIDPAFEPRDLDKHYEALRKSIHHVADGVDGISTSPFTPMTGIPESSGMQHASSDPGAHTSSFHVDPESLSGEQSVSHMDSESEPHVKSVVSHPGLEDAVDVPPAIPENEVSESRRESQTAETSSSAVVEEESEPNPWADTETPSINRGSKGMDWSGNPKDANETTPGTKKTPSGVDQLDKLMQAMKAEEEEEDVDGEAK